MLAYLKNQFYRLFNADVEVLNDSSGAYRVGLVKKYDLGQATGAGGVLSVKNPFGKDVIVTRLAVRVTTGVATRTVDAGIAANGTTSSDTLLDGASVATAGIVDNLDDGGTNGGATVYWGADKYLTMTASGAVATLAGAAYIHYHLA